MRVLRVGFLLLVFTLVLVACGAPVVPAAQDAMRVDVMRLSADDHPVPEGGWIKSTGMAVVKGADSFVLEVDVLGASYYASHDKTGTILRTGFGAGDIISVKIDGGPETLFKFEDGQLWSYTPSKN